MYSVHPDGVQWNLGARSCPAIVLHRMCAIRSVCGPCCVVYSNCVSHIVPNRIRNCPVDIQHPCCQMRKRLADELENASLVESSSSTPQVIQDLVFHKRVGWALFSAHERIVLVDREKKQGKDSDGWICGIVRGYCLDTCFPMIIKRTNIN